MMKKVTFIVIILYLILASTTILIYSVKAVKAMEPEEIGVRCAAGLAVPKQYERFCRGEVRTVQGYRNGAWNIGARRSHMRHMQRNR